MLFSQYKICVLNYFIVNAKGAANVVVAHDAINRHFEFLINDGICSAGGQVENPEYWMQQAFEQIDLALAE